MDWDKGPWSEQKQKQKLFYLDKTIFDMSMILPLASCCVDVSIPGGIFDCVFKCDKQISSVVRMSFYQLRWRPTSLPVIFRGLSMISLAHVVILWMLDLISHHFALGGCPKCSSPSLNRKKSVIPSHLYWPPDTGFNSFLGSSSEFYLFLRVSVARCHLFLSELLQPLTPASQHWGQQTNCSRRLLDPCSKAEVMEPFQ